MMKVKIIIVSFFSLAVLNLSAAEWTKLNTLTNDLERIVQPTADEKDLEEIKSTLSERNMDIEIAYENYVIAQKQVSVARAAFNPLRTSHALGIALGIEYLWTPILIDAVISIPTKLYNVSKNKYIAKASSYSYEAAKDSLFNEMAKLYYDILTHEMILETIDLELGILNNYERVLSDNEASAATLAENRKAILKLGMERTDIYKLYSAELAAYRTMLSYDIRSLRSVKLAPVAFSLSAQTTDHINLGRLEDIALYGNDSHKAAINLHRAAIQNVKSVRWSILSFSGLNFSYGRRVRVAKNEVEISRLERESSEISVRSGARDSLNKLESAIRVNENYSAIYNDSLSLFEDIQANWLDDRLGDETAVRAALDLVRDFRNEVVARYRSMAALDSLSYATSLKLSPKAAASRSLQDQIKRNGAYGLTENDFRVTGSKWDESIEVSLVKRPELAWVESVEYIFDSKSLGKLSSSRRDRAFSAWRSTNNRNFSKVRGEAFVTLKNGHEFIIDFSF